jgi:hypothetical protein
MRIDDIPSSNLGKIYLVRQMRQIRLRLDRVSRSGGGPIRRVEISLFVVERDSGLQWLEEWSKCGVSSSVERGGHLISSRSGRGQGDVGGKSTVRLNVSIVLRTVY